MTAEVLAVAIAILVTITLLTGYMLALREFQRINANLEQFIELGRVDEFDQT